MLRVARLGICAGSYRGRGGAVENPHPGRKDKNAATLCPADEDLSEGPRGSASPLVVGPVKKDLGQRCGQRRHGSRLAVRRATASKSCCAA